MTYNPAKHHRRSIRLKGYDYSQSGLYFITICCQNKACIFGHIENGIMILNHAGQMIENEWLRLPQRFQNIQLHEYIVMSNHFHAILEIVVGSTLVVDLNNIDNGQPQGIAPTVDQNITNFVGSTPTENQNITNPVGSTLVVDLNNIAPTIAPTIAQTVDQNITNFVVGSTLVVDLDNIDTGQPQGIAPTEKTVGEIVGAFKSITTVEYIRVVKKNNWQAIDKRLWQRNYHEHIIRNEQSYINISNYIINNPVNWDEDVLQ